MQDPFDFIAADVASWTDPLTQHFGRLVGEQRRRPLAQFVKSMISSRTRDEVSLEAYRRLGRRWPRALDLARASPAAIEETIFDVTFPDKKAEYLPTALRMIEAQVPDLDLDCLTLFTLDEALGWLERLPGVGRKVAAATLNASTLGLRVFIVDSHVHRVLVRLGFIPRTATPRTASERVTASSPSLDAEDLLQLFAQMKRLGQTICRLEAPQCPLCPLIDHCRTAKAMDAEPPHAYTEPFPGGPRQSG